MPRLRGVGTVLLGATVLATSGVARPADPPRTKTYPQAENVVRPPDERRPEEPLSVPLFGRPLTFGGELTTQTGYEGNFALRSGAADDLAFIGQELELELSYQLPWQLSVFVQGEAFYEALFETARGDRSTEAALELGEAWLDAEDLRGSGLSLQLGRQAIWEERNWWWDDTVDAVRLQYDRRRLEFQAAVGRDMGRLTTEHDGRERERRDNLQGLGHVAWRWASDHWLDGFVLYRDGKLLESTVDRLVRTSDEETSDADLLWLGARLSGEFELGGRLGELDHLLEGAWVGGHVTPSGRAGTGRERDASGWALIAEGAWETEWPRRPVLTVGYAFGSIPTRAEAPTAPSARLASAATTAAWAASSISTPTASWWSPSCRICTSGRWPWRSSSCGPARSRSSIIRTSRPTRPPFSAIRTWPLIRPADGGASATHGTPCSGCRSGNGSRST